MTDDVANVIATASLLLAVTTALLGLWYGDVSTAIDQTEPRLPAERTTLRRRLTPIFWSKALPLALGSTTITGVFMPRSLAVATSSVGLRGGGWRYDDLKAAFATTEVLLLLLAVATVRLAAMLGVKCMRLR